MYGRSSEGHEIDEYSQETIENFEEKTTESHSERKGEGEGRESEES